MKRKTKTMFGLTNARAMVVAFIATIPGCGGDVGSTSATPVQTGGSATVVGSSGGFAIGTSGGTINATSGASSGGTSNADASTGGTSGIGHSFACGTDTCVVGESYCLMIIGGAIFQDTTPPPNNGIGSCAPLPANCAQATDCSCFQDTGGGDSCTSSNGEIHVTRFAV